MKTIRLLASVLTLIAVGCTTTALIAADDRAALRLYVLDGGTIKDIDLLRFRLSREEVATTDLSVTCYLIAHPRGVLL